MIVAGIEPAILCVYLLLPGHVKQMS